jgi:hypothetical protein
MRIALSADTRSMGAVSKMLGPNARPKLYRSDEQAGWFAVLGVAFLVGVSWVAADAPPDVAGVWLALIVAIGVAGCAFLVRGALAWGVRIGAEEVTISGPTKTVRLHRSAVDHFELPWKFPLIARAVARDGATYPIWGIAVPRAGRDEKRSKYEWIVEQMNAELAT